MKPPIEYRRPRLALLDAPDHRSMQKERTDLARRVVETLAVPLVGADAELAHKKAVKAAQMRRYRARKSGIYIPV